MTDNNNYNKSHMDAIKLDKIEDAINDFRNGKFVIVVDDEDRENEGDLIMAAEKVTPDHVNFMITNARGELCAPVTISRCKELDLDHQVEENTSMLGTPFTITIDKLEGCTTGVSAHDRAETIKALADSKSTPKSFGRPGMYIRFMPRIRACCAVPVTPRRQLTLRVSPDSIRPPL